MLSCDYDIGKRGGEGAKYECKVCLVHQANLCLWFLWCEAVKSPSTPPWMGCLSITGVPPPPPPALHSLVAIYTLGRRDCESKVPCSRTQHNVPSQGLNPKNECINHDATVPPGLIAFENRRFVFSQCQLLLSLIVVGFACPQKLTFSHSNVYYNLVVVYLL